MVGWFYSGRKIQKVLRRRAQKTRTSAVINREGGGGKLRRTFYLARISQISPGPMHVVMFRAVPRLESLSHCQSDDWNTITMTILSLIVTAT